MSFSLLEHIQLILHTVELSALEQRNHTSVLNYATLSRSPTVSRVIAHFQLAKEQMFVLQ